MFTLPFRRVKHSKCTSLCCTSILEGLGTVAYVNIHIFLSGVQGVTLISSSEGHQTIYPARTLDLSVTFVSHPSTILIRPTLLVKSFLRPYLAKYASDRNLYNNQKNHAWTSSW